MTTETTQATGADITQAGVQADADGVKTEGEGKVTTEPVANAAAKDETDPSKTEAKADVTYEFKVPEGMELDTARAAEFTTIAKELGLTPEVAQKLVDLDSKRVQAGAEAQQALVKGWADEVRADKELGGDKLTESLATAKKAIDLGPPELKELLNSTGLGNHPAVFKWAHTIGKAMSEDTFKTGIAPGVKGSMADRLYGTPAKT